MKTTVAGTVSLEQKDKLTELARKAGTTRTEYVGAIITDKLLGTSPIPELSRHNKRLVWSWVDRLTRHDNEKAKALYRAIKTVFGIPSYVNMTSNQCDSLLKSTVLCRVDRSGRIEMEIKL